MSSSLRSSSAGFEKVVPMSHKLYFAAYEEIQCHEDDSTPYISQEEGNFRNANIFGVGICGGAILQKNSLIFTLR